jgi:hypothetical protein
VLLDPARAFRPKDKPRIEALQGYIRRSFFAGREFKSLQHMIQAARTWCDEVAGRRTPRTLEGRTPLEVFSEEEAGALRALPDVPYELARWSRPKVAPDAHVKVGRCLYSVPYRLIGRHLDARETNVIVEMFLDGECVKTHPRQLTGRRTDWADLPEHRVGFFMRNPNWCRTQAFVVGANCERVIAELLSINALFRLRQAQGVLRLADKYGDARLEAACHRALCAGDPSYLTIKGILAAGTEYEPAQEVISGIDTPAWLRGPEAFGDEL